MVSRTPDVLAFIRPAINLPGDERPRAFFINEVWRLFVLCLLRVGHVSSVSRALVVIHKSEPRSGVMLKSGTQVPGKKRRAISSREATACVVSSCRHFAARCVHWSTFLGLASQAIAYRRVATRDRYNNEWRQPGVSTKFIGSGDHASLATTGIELETQTTVIPRSQQRHSNRHVVLFNRTTPAIAAAATRLIIPFRPRTMSSRSRLHASTASRL